MRKSIILPFLLFLTTFYTLAQSEYTIESISIMNLGDGRLLHRDAKTDEPLNGEHRLIDGIRSEYILAQFKDGLYDGTFKHFSRNLLTVEGTYQGGLKEGAFKFYYPDGETVQTESSFVADKLDGGIKQFDRNGQVEKEENYKNGKPHGLHRHYNPETGEIRMEETYVDGKLEGKQFRHITGSKEYTETTYYKDGLQEGSYTRETADGIKTETGAYLKGKKTGPWIKLKADGDSLEIKTYENGELNGLSVEYFTTGKRSKEYMYKNGKRDGKCIDYDNNSGNPKKITHYKANKEHGTVKIWMTSSGHNFIETTTWENGKRNGPYEAVYQENTRQMIKEGTLKEQGQYKNGSKVGVWKYYDTKGNLTSEKNMDN